MNSGRWSRTTVRKRLTALLAVVGLSTFATAIGAAGPAQAAPEPAGPPVGVVVRYGPAGSAAAERAVAALGGSVGRRLDLVNGFAAQVPQDAVARLSAAPGIVTVTPDGRLRLAADAWDADKDVSSMYSITKAAGVHDAWSRSDAAGKKITGQGVGVALIDSGVAPVEGLNGTGKVVNGPDLSFESQADNLRYLDTYGHGTHLAGIIAGRDPEVSAGNENTSDHFVGVAPGAHVVSLKVAAANGAVDVSQVIAAIDWVVTHRNDPGLNIRVLNLSFGTDSVQDRKLDPLSYAVEAAWRNGIVVVVAVGNDGAAASQLSMPATNPFVIAVGAADPRGTESRGDDTVASFSTRGNSMRHADLVAAGKSVVSLRDPNSYVDVNNPGALVAGDAEQRFFRGSGTSQSAAVVSGAAALLLQQRPTLTPDQVKRILVTSADSMATSDAVWRGAGQLDVKGAMDTKTPSYKQLHTYSSGLGTLEGARGSAHVADPDNGVELTGEQDIMGKAWNAQTWAAAAAQGNAWTGGTWNGTDWTGSDWTGSSWAARTWSARTWSGENWAARTWSARTWSDAEWTGLTWSARTWSARTWSARTWSGDIWAATTWQ